MGRANPKKRDRGKTIFERHAAGVVVHKEEPILPPVDPVVEERKIISEAQTIEIRHELFSEKKELNRTLYQRTVHSASHVIQRPSARHGEVKRYSDEVIKNADFIRNTQGEQAAKSYLDQISKGETMEPNQQQTEQHQFQTPSATIGSGSIEAALEDARKKSKEYRGLSQQFSDEADRQDQIIAKLQEAMDFLKAPRSAVRAAAQGQPTPVASGKRIFRDWKAIFQTVLYQNNFAPMKKNEIIHAVKRAYPDANEPTIYGAINTWYSSGFFSEVDDDGVKKLRLSSTLAQSAEA